MSAAVLQIARGQQVPAEHGRKGHPRGENRQAHGSEVKEGEGLQAVVAQGLADQDVGRGADLGRQSAQ